MPATDRMALRRAPASLPDGLRVYAVGDVHGCLARLETLHARIRADLEARPVRESVLVHVGDYVDRGPDSAGVVDRLSRQVLPAVTRRVDLMGNHEMIMLQALRGERQAGSLWLDNGGVATLASYGTDGSASPEAWRQAIPPAHRLWLLQRGRMHREGGYVFVHAGIRPGRPLAEQDEQDLLWIREPFLSDETTHEAVVVHGHTPGSDPVVLANRIGIDTGAALGGVLTALVLEGDRLGFLSA